MKLAQVILLIGALTLAGCSGEAFDRTACRASVMAKYPNSDVAPIPNSNFKFIVRLPSGEIRVVYTMSVSSPKITRDFLYMSPRNNRDSINRESHRISSKYLEPHI